jgi:hypothetical protein
VRKAGDKVENKILSNVTQREFRKEKWLSRESFVKQMGNNGYKPKPHLYKILKHLKNGIREAADIHLH